MTESRLALTIDDLPWHQECSQGALRRNLYLLSRVLSDRKIPVTGFINGFRPHLDETQVWLDSGLALGNHTYSHLALSSTTSDTFIADIVRNEHEIEKVLRYDLRRGWFRYPYLDHGDNAEKREAVVRALQKRNYTTAPVTINTCDYSFARHRAFQKPSARLVGLYLDHICECVEYFKALGTQLYARDIPHVLLLHANSLNAKHIGSLLDRLRHLGCRFIPLEEVMRDAAYQLFSVKAPVSSKGDRGDLLGTIASLKGTVTSPDPSRTDYFMSHWQKLIQPYSCTAVS